MKHTPAFLLLFLTAACAEPQVAPAPAGEPAAAASEKIRLLIDTDANNELDDQHALAYVLLNPDVFEIEGITVNRTSNGGDIEAQAEEAERVIRLCARDDELAVARGASGSFREIAPTLDRPDYDGAEAVRLIIERAHAEDPRPLVLLPVGKLTNIALALTADPSIASKVRVVWLGSNWPEPGEYNLVNDTSAVNPVLASGAPFEMALVRYGRSSGTGAVQAHIDEIRIRMPGRGPRVDPPVEGRHGGAFSTFGDYSVNLFEHVPESSRALYDMAAAAIVKNPAWAERVSVGPYRYVDGQWVRQEGGAHDLVVWELFHTSKILEDFYATVEVATPGGGVRSP